MLYDYKTTNDGMYFTDDGWQTSKKALKLDFANVNGSHLTKEAESLRSYIVEELKKLKSDKAGSINTINIEYAINIVKSAMY